MSTTHNMDIVTTVSGNAEKKFDAIYKKVLETIKVTQKLTPKINSITDAVNSTAMGFKSVDDMIFKATQSAKIFGNTIKKTSKITAFDMLKKQAGDTEKLVNMNKNLTQGLKIQGQELKGLAGWWERSKSGIAGFNGALLSTMFLGMQMQKTFGDAFKSIFEGYKKIIPEGHMFNRMTTQLSANWEFFKFQLADALAQSPVFQTLVQWTISLLKALQQLSPAIKLFITAGLGIGAIAGGLLFFVGVVGLGIAGLIDLAGKATVAKAAMLGLKGALGVAGVAVAIGLTVAAWKKFSTSSEYAEEKAGAMKKALTTLAKNAINPLQEALGAAGINFQKFEDVVVWVGATIQNTIIVLAQVLAIFVLSWRTGWNVMQAALKIAVSGMLDMINMLIAPLRAVLNALEFFGLAPKWLSKAINAFDGVRSSMSDISSEVADIKDAWNDFAETSVDLAAAVVDPAMAVRQAQVQRDIDSASQGNLIVVQNARDAVEQGFMSNEDYERILSAYSSVGATGQ